MRRETSGPPAVQYDSPTYQTGNRRSLSWAYSKNMMREIFSVPHQVTSTEIFEFLIGPRHILHLNFLQAHRYVFTMFRLESAAVVGVKLRPSPILTLPVAVGR